MSLIKKLVSYTGSNEGAVELWKEKLAVLDGYSMREIIRSCESDQDKVEAIEYLSYIVSIHFKDGEKPNGK